MTMKTLVTGAKWTTQMAGVKISMEGYVNNKYSGKELGRANLLLLVHGIVVETSKALGTDAYYDGIQKLYEDAIVMSFARIHAQLRKCRCGGSQEKSHYPCGIPHSCNRRPQKSV